jgi:hypothetical protein
MARKRRGREIGGRYGLSSLVIGFLSVEPLFCYQSNYLGKSSKHLRRL